MNSIAIGVLAEAGFQGPEAEIVLRHLLSELVTPSATARRALEELGLSGQKLDPSLASIPEIVRAFADAELSETAAREIFGEDGARAMLALVRSIDRLEQLQGS